MDLLTQGLLGACTAATAADRKNIRQVVLIGFIAGLAADLDILISSPQDPLLNLEFHRHFTHSLFFVPVAAALLALVLWPVYRKQFAPSRLFLYTLLGYLPSGFLDACTSYGTRMLWPLTDQRFSFNIISIIDPIFTLLLLAAVLLSLLYRLKLALSICLVLAGSYLLLGVYQREQVKQQVAELAQQRGHDAAEILVKPTLGNLVLWRSVYASGDRYYIDAIHRVPLSGRVHVIEGENIARFNPQELQLDEQSVLYQDVKRFQFFSDGYLAWDPTRPEFLIDVRYANLPHRIHPLWGIHIDTRQPQQHARYEILRDRSAATRDRFLNLLFNPESKPTS